MCLFSQVINFYMNLLVERSKHPNLPSVNTFNTFFYPKLRSSGYSAVRRWTKKMDVFAKDLLLVPVHLGVHWCLSVSPNDCKIKVVNNGWVFSYLPYLNGFFFLLLGSGFPQKDCHVLWFDGRKQWWSMPVVVVSFCLEC